MTTVLFKDIKPGDVFTVTRQSDVGETYRTTYHMGEDRVVYLHPYSHFRSGRMWSPLQKCERHCPGAL